MPHRTRLQELQFPGRDVGFAALIRSLSEPDSGPHADNLITNEDSFPRVCGLLRRRSPRGGVYLGVGPDQNFTYIAHCRPALSFVLDYRRRNLVLHLLHKALFMLSGDRVSYLSRLTARDPGPLPADSTADPLVAAFDAAPFDAGAGSSGPAPRSRPCSARSACCGDEEFAELATIQARLAGPGMAAKFLALPIYPTFGELIRTADREGEPAHLLATEESYRAVRDDQRADLVVPLVADLAGDAALPRLADWLKGRGLGVAVVYVSDVEFFLLRGGRFDAYRANLERLPRLDGAADRPHQHPADRPPGPRPRRLGHHDRRAAGRLPRRRPRRPDRHARRPVRGPGVRRRLDG